MNDGEEGWEDVVESPQISAARNKTLDNRTKILTNVNGGNTTNKFGCSSCRKANTLKKRMLREGMKNEN
jgi:hypothetical protein